MRLYGDAIRRTILLGESDKHHHLDTEHRIDAFLPELDELITAGVAFADPVQVYRYVGRGTPPELP